MSPMKFCCICNDPSDTPICLESGNIKLCFCGIGHLRKWVDDPRISSGLPSELLLESINILDLTVRAWNVLDRNGIKTIGQLIERTPFELLRQKNFGEKSLRNVIEELSKIGLLLNQSQLGSTNWPPWNRPGTEPSEVA